MNMKELYNNPKTELILKRLAEREVYTIVDSMVRFILCSNSELVPFDYEDVCNKYAEIEGGEGGETYSQVDDVNLWYSVSEYLYRALRQVNEVVIDGPNNYLWGRQSGNCALEDGGELFKAAYHLEILPGQKNSWENRV